MSKSAKVIITFIVSFLIAYLIVGYVLNAMFVAIDWVEGATIWSKLREYYVRNAGRNFIPALVIALIPALVTGIKKPTK